MEEEPDWKAEAEAVIHDVKSHVKDIHISSVPPPNRGIYLNLTTIEGKMFCVLLGPRGFQVVGNAFNDISLHNDNQVFETPYSLLSSLSTMYDKSFGDLLVQKLKALQSDNHV